MAKENEEGEAKSYCLPSSLHLFPFPSFSLFLHREENLQPEWGKRGEKRGKEKRKMRSPIVLNFLHLSLLILFLFLHREKKIKRKWRKRGEKGAKELLFSFFSSSLSLFLFFLFFSSLREKYNESERKEEKKGPRKRRGKGEVVLNVSNGRTRGKERPSEHTAAGQTERQADGRTDRQIHTR